MKKHFGFPSRFVDNCMSFHYFTRSLSDFRSPALDHIMVRGINKTAISEDDQYRKRFLERPGNAVMEGQCALYARVL
jgi:hypothetical protein